jgi:hypothetical protein
MANRSEAWPINNRQREYGTPSHSNLLRNFTYSLRFSLIRIPVNFREWERQPFFLTLIAKKWLPRPQFIVREGFYEAVGLDF